VIDKERRIFTEPKERCYALLSLCC
jgi:hypothetical protein